MVRNFWNKLESGVYKICEALVAASSVVLTALVLLTVVDVAMRNFVGQPIKGVFEISQQMMAYVVFMGLAHTLRRGGHVRVTIALERSPNKLRTTMELLASLAGMLLCVVLVRGGWSMFRSSWITREIMPAAIGIPYWTAKFAMPIGLFVMALVFLTILLDSVRRLVASSKGH